jgi:CPA2 family monovalent cation:H+ antiporter-2
VGMMIEPKFIIKNGLIIAVLVIAIFTIKTLVNALIFKVFKKRWVESFYFGALLAQIGEFSFLLAATGFQGKIITNFAYQLTITLISITLVVSPFWIAFNKGAYRAAKRYQERRRSGEVE